MLPKPNSIYPPQTRSQIVQWAALADLERVMLDRDPIFLLSFLDFIWMYSDRLWELIILQRFEGVIFGMKIYSR